MLEEILAGGAKALGISLPEGAIKKYRIYLDALLSVNMDLNLTAIEDEDQAARLHFLDALGLVSRFDLGASSVIDVGAGGGIPGLALKLASPDIELTLLDATGKKVRFLSEVAELLGLSAGCVCGRAEELGREPEYRERFDAAVSRAVARLNSLAELCMPFVRVGGHFLAMKAADSDEEIHEAGSAIEKLGGRLCDTREYTIPGTDIVRRVVIIEKTAPTPERYPRRWAAIQKRAL